MKKPQRPCEDCDTLVTPPKRLCPVCGLRRRKTSMAASGKRNRQNTRKLRGPNERTEDESCPSTKTHCIICGSKLSLETDDLGNAIVPQCVIPIMQAIKQN